MLINVIVIKYVTESDFVTIKRDMCYMGTNILL